VPLTAISLKVRHVLTGFVTDGSETMFFIEVDGHDICEHMQCSIRVEMVECMETECLGTDCKH